VGPPIFIQAWFAHVVHFDNESFSVDATITTWLVHVVMIVTKFDAKEEMCMKNVVQEVDMAIHVQRNSKYVLTN
jgi:hypothetical protein